MNRKERVACFQSRRDYVRENASRRGNEKVV